MGVSWSRHAHKLCKELQGVHGHEWASWRQSCLWVAPAPVSNPNINSLAHFVSLVGMGALSEENGWLLSLQEKSHNRNLHPKAVVQSGICSAISPKQLDCRMWMANLSRSSYSRANKPSLTSLLLSSLWNPHLQFWVCANACYFLLLWLSSIVWSQVWWCTHSIVHCA